MKGQSHPRPEPWPLTAEGHSAKDCREELGRMKVGVGLLTTSQVTPVPREERMMKGSRLPMAMANLFDRPLSWLQHMFKVLKI